MDDSGQLLKSDKLESDCENTSTADSVRKPTTAEATALEQQKMEALVRFAGGLGHDFNNLLTPIVGYAEMLRKLCATDERCLKRVQGILDASAKARDLARQLLAIGSRKQPALEIFDLNQLLTSLSPTLAQILRPEIEVSMKLDPGPGSIRADRRMVEQAIINLALNAQESMPAAGTLSFGTQSAELLTPPDNLPELKPGSYVILTVSDSGHGISQEALAHIFEPYFSANECGKGSGLWLTTVFGIVRRNGGQICAFSEEGRGTSFTIYLPRLTETTTTCP